MSRRSPMGQWLQWLVMGLLGCAGMAALARGEQSLAMLRSPHAGKSLLVAASPGRWRLASDHDMGRVVLWVSQILVAHRDSNPRGAGLYQMKGWNSGVARPSRDRAEALRVATALLHEVQHYPERFEDLARTRSDDAGSARRGGRLGGMRAPYFAPWVLDELQAAERGRPLVLETDEGFHVLRLEAPPVEHTVQGRRLVIQHRGIVERASRGNPTRTREQARAMAMDIAALQTPFPGRIERFSEHPDRVLGGNIGRWRTTGPFDNGPLLQALAELAEGEISEPLDTQDGFVLIQRVPLAPEENFSAEALLWRYDPDAPETEDSSRQSRCQAARRSAQEVKSNPALFDTSKHRWPSGGPLEFRAGTAIAPLERALRGLRGGQIGEEVVDFGWACAVVKRLPAAPVQEMPPLAFALPAPDAISLDEVVAHSPGEALAREVTLASEDLEAWLHWPRERTEVARQGLLQLATQLRGATEADERLELKSIALGHLEDQLGAERRRELQRAIERWASARVLEGSQRY